ncbi:hypothetical protein V9K67_23890 [Paraflavisolibacter sp. H34]|uniref:hypothetical protein n=1 Tax=Huijunlia imazamoxiresistens TaxID=3127457 RepID=UPI003015AED0
MKKAFLQLTAAALVIALTAPSCASIVSKSAYPVSIDTRPSGAQVSITDKKGKEIYKGTSPAAVRLKSGAGFFSRAEYQVRLSAKGYSEKVIPVTFKLNGWYFGNLLIGGLLGMLIIDPATGAMWRIDKYSDDINEVLQKDAGATATTSTTTATSTPTLKVIDIKDVPAHLKNQLVKIK